MYRCRLNVLVFSRRKELTRWLEEVPSYERFEHCFMSPLAEFSPDECGDADIIIFDIPLEGIPTTVRHFCPSRNTRIVICAGSEIDEPRFEPLIEQADEIWGENPGKKRLQRQFLALLKREYERQEGILCQKYLDTLIDSVPDLIWFKDRRGAHLKVNDSFCRAVGKTKSQCANRGHYYIWDVNEEEYAKGEYVCLETDAETFRANRPCFFDEKVKCKNGMRHFKTYKSPLYDEDGRIMGTVGMAHDVTDLKNMGTELAIILNSLSVGAVITDKDNKFVTINGAFAETFSIEPQKLVNTSYEEWKERTFGTQQAATADGAGEISCQSGGAEHVFDLLEQVIYDVFNCKVGTFAIFRDITEHKRHMELLSNYQGELEREVELKTQRIRDMQKQIILSFASIVSSRDKVTGDHIKNTSRYVDILVEGMAKAGSRYAETLTPAYAAIVSLAAPMHDIGKIAVPDAILNKPGKYLPEEYEVMKKHSEKGGEIIEETLAVLEDREFYRLVLEMALFHHERWDGRGYPHGLSGEDIPLSARIMALADVFDALVSERPYKRAFSVEDAFRIIVEGSGTQFDPGIVSVFIAQRARIEAAAAESRTALRVSE